MEVNEQQSAFNEYPTNNTNTKLLPGSEDPNSLLATQSDRILELESAIEESIKERNELREKLKQVSRSLEKIEGYFSTKCELKERELRHFLLPSPPRSGAISDSADPLKTLSSSSPTSSNISTNPASIKSTVPAIRPVPTLITASSAKPVDSLLGPPGAGLLPTPTLVVGQTHNFKPTNLSRSTISRSAPIQPPGKLQSGDTGLDETKDGSYSHQTNNVCNSNSNTSNSNYYGEVPLDCSVSLILSKLRRTQEQFDQLIANNQAELQSFTFTQNSQNGKRIMMRIRVLEQENEELANINRTGRIARLESEIALRRRFVDDLKLAHADTEFLIEETDSETELFGGSLQVLQQRLKLAQAKAVVFSSALEEECNSADFVQPDEWSNQTPVGNELSDSISPLDTKSIFVENANDISNSPLSLSQEMSPKPKSTREPSTSPSSPHRLVISKKRSRDTFKSHRKFPHPTDNSGSPTPIPPVDPCSPIPNNDHDGDGDMSPSSNSPLCKKSRSTRHDPAPTDVTPHVPNSRTRKQRPIIPIKGPQRTFCSSSGHESQTPADESLERTAMPESSPTQNVFDDDDNDVILNDDDELSEPDIGIHDPDSNDLPITTNTITSAAANATTTTTIDSTGNRNSNGGGSSSSSDATTTTHVCRNEPSFSGPLQGPPSNGQLGGLRVLE